MRATILVDNIGRDALAGEWGLSIFIDQVGAERAKILLDAGATDLFLANAAALGLDIAAVEHAVLSHAHYDHANGLEAFFRRNQKARLYLSGQAAANCYKIEDGQYKYIGMPANILTEFGGRLQPVEGCCQLLDKVYLLPHTTPGLAALGKQAQMYLKQDDGSWRPDDFSHEQSLIFDTPQGLVIFNSCSHGGVENIINEASRQLNRPVRMLIGGFHLYQRTNEEVRTLAAYLRQAGLQAIYTGHCTGQPAFEILRQELGEMVHQLQVGLQIEF